MGRTQAEDSHHRASQFAKAVASGAIGEILPAFSHLGDQDIQRTDSVWKPQSIQPLGDRALLLLVRSKEPYIRLHERDPRIKADSETIRKSLEGNWRPEHLFTLARSRDLCCVYQQQIVNCDLEIEKMLPEFEPRADPAERPLPADRERRRARRMQKWPPRPEFDLRTET